MLIKSYSTLNRGVRLGLSDAGYRRKVPRLPGKRDSSERPVQEVLSFLLASKILIAACELPQNVSPMSSNYFSDTLRLDSVSSWSENRELSKEGVGRIVEVHDTS